MKQNLGIAFVLCFWVFILAACKGDEPTHTQDVSVMETVVEQTVIAQSTLHAAQTMAAAGTHTAIAMLASPTPSPSPSPVPPSPTPTPQPSACNQAELITEVTPLTAPVLAPGMGFTHVWRVRNSGSCTWSEGYALVFTAGELMGATPSVGLPYEVPPERIVDIAVQFYAPQYAGVYTGNWMLRSPDGMLFGIGPSAQKPLQVTARVVAPAEPGTYDLALNYCLAQWRSQGGILPCPGAYQDQHGSVRLLYQPIMEASHTAELGLRTRPGQTLDGFISGTYPGYKIRTGDRFQSHIGCLVNSSGCNVIFQINYQILGGGVGSLGSWQEQFDGVLTPLNIDLSFLAGQTVRLILEVYNNGRPENANAVWLDPRINSAPTAQETVLAWRQEGGINDICNELRIDLNPFSAATAYASSCEVGNKPLGSSLLTSPENELLTSWLRRFAPYEAVTYSASNTDPLVTNTAFNGWGDAEAFSSDIEAMQRFTEKIYNRIVK